ncbi:unnamed protein product [Sphagnum jensenii]
MIVREGRSLFAATNEMNLGMTNRECENISKTQAFQEVLRTRRNLYYKEIANDPSLTRNAVKGQLVLAINKMLEKELYDKAANAIMQLAKLEGWTSDGTNAFEKGLTYAVQYAIPVEKLVAILFPSTAAIGTTAVDAVTLIQNAVLQTEQAYAAQGKQSGTGAQKSADVLTLAGSAVLSLLKQAGISNADTALCAEFGKRCCGYSQRHSGGDSLMVDTRD